MTERNESLSEVIPRERDRLYGFIRRRVPNRRDAEDILQDVFFEFVRACSLPEPIERVGVWLVRVARNRIIDRVRKRREESLPEQSQTGDDIQGADGKAYPLVLGSNTFIPGFEPELIGLKAGDEKTFDITFPKDYGVAALQSRAVKFAVKVIAVKEVVEPKLDDEFAAMLQDQHSFQRGS